MQSEIDDLVQNFLAILKDHAIIPEIALVAAADTINRLAAIARSQALKAEILKDSLEAVTKRN